MIDGPQATARVAQQMAGLAVSIVGDDVECGDAGEIEIVRALKFPDRARRLGLNEELNGAHAMGAVADDGWWDERPADSSAHQERGVLASIQGPVWEIPQRPLSAPRLVHAESAQPLEGEADAKRVVRAPGDMLAARDLTV